MDNFRMSRWLVVPIASVIVFGLGLAGSALLGLLWRSMPAYVYWGIPCLLLLWYLFDAMRREGGA